MKLQLFKETSSIGTIFFMIYKDDSIDSCIYGGNLKCDTEDVIQEKFNNALIRFSEIKLFTEEKKELIFEEII